MNLLRRIARGMSRTRYVTLNRFAAISLSSHVQVCPPADAKVLEAAWQRRRQELGGWQPSNGWLIDPSASDLPALLRKQAE